MQVENNIQSKSSPSNSERSPPKEINASQSKQSRAQNRIARYEQKPQRKASKMLVRLLQWADKLVIKFFTKRFLPSELQIFFNRQARANKVQLKKAQIDYSVQDFAVRLYVFWVCQNYFQKTLYEQNLEKLLLELRDQLTRKKKNLSQSLQTCEQQTQKKQKQEELKWMAAIISGLSTFIYRYSDLSTEDEILQFLLEITSNIMIDCLRKPGNKLAKKKEKLKIKIKYFQQKIGEIMGNPEQKLQHLESEKKASKVIQKNTIIISPGHNPFEPICRTISNSSAFSLYKGKQTSELNKQVSKKHDFEVRLEYPKKYESLVQQQQKKNIEIKSQLFISKQQIEKIQEIGCIQKGKSQTSPTSQIKMQGDVQISQSLNSEISEHEDSQSQHI